MKAFDSADKSLDGWRFASVKWEACVDMEGMNAGDVGFNGFGLQSPMTEEGNPLEQCSGRCREIVTWCFEQVWAQADEVNVGSLASGVGLASAGCEAMPEEEGDLWRVLSMRLIPVSWDFV